MRESGILMPVSSIPSKYGIGCFSKEAFEFIDFLVAAGQKMWQVLPLGPTSYGDSPYQSFSTFAGNPYFIDLEALIGCGLLSYEECDACDFGEDEKSVDYEALYKSRYKVLKKAFRRFTSNREYETFVEENKDWLDDYSMYMAIKDVHEGKSWDQWPKALRQRDPAELCKVQIELKDDIEFYRFLQYMFHKQWKNLHEYANKKGISIIGDIPIYIAYDSADAWANPALFELDEDLKPIIVAGCPPDAFSKTGQLWGNPIYAWDYHKKTGYAWWLKRMRQCMQMYDVIRVDHFRGFDEYYTIPYEDETAEHGAWKKGPGMDLFAVIQKEMPNTRVIAEDLGFITDTVIKLVHDTGYPGMKVLQFAFDSREESDYLPHNYDKNCVVYTGTHDNDTIRGWYDTMDPEDRKLSVRYMNNATTPRSEIHWDFIRMAMASVANLCIIPVQDYLGLGTEARINIPSTLGGNWTYRLEKGQLTEELAGKIKKMTKLYGR